MSLDCIINAEDVSLTPASQQHIQENDRELIIL